MGPTPLKNKMEIQGAALAVEGQHPTEIQRAALAAKATTPWGGGGGGAGSCIGCQRPTPWGGGGGLHWLSRANTWGLVGWGGVLHWLSLANTGGAALVVKGEQGGGGGGGHCQGPSPGGGSTGCQGPAHGDGGGWSWISCKGPSSGGGEGGTALAVKGWHLGVVWGWGSGGCAGCQRMAPGGCVGVGVRGLHWLSRAIRVMVVHGAQCSAKPRSFDLLTDLEPHS